MIEQWMIDAAREIVQTLKYAQKGPTHYPDEVKGIAEVISEHFRRSKLEQKRDLAHVYPSGAIQNGPLLELNKVLPLFKSFDIFRFIYITGGIVNNQQTKNDIDIVNFLPTNNSLYHPIRFRFFRQLPRDIASRIQWIDSQPDHDFLFTNHIPLYALAAIRLPEQIIQMAFNDPESVEKNLLLEFNEIGL